MALRKFDSDATIAVLPVSDQARQRLLAVNPGDWHVPRSAVEQWLSPSQAFFLTGHAAVLIDEGRGALLVTLDARPRQDRWAAFSLLRVAPDLDGEAAEASAIALLRAARQWAFAHDARHLRGPLPFSTWFPYRVLADDREQGPVGFFGEAVEPVSYNRWYRAAGFQVTDRYVTMALPEDPTFWETHLTREAALSARRRDHFLVRPLSPQDGAALLPVVHGWINAAFADNAYFSPLGQSDFIDRVLGALPAEAEPIRLAAFDPSGSPFGVLTGHLEGDRGVLKTIAVHPDVRRGRCAMALSFAFHRMLYERGLTRAWHAQMHECNASARMSAKYARPVRHYVVYGDTLRH
ncbi:MAG: hypothetical protein VKP62_16415 [Candidatus Sericytochromatia bacterium]|nr:hypothetical protein [Candidatus Sericytochromatia bacterium]